MVVNTDNYNDWQSGIDSLITAGVSEFGNVGWVDLLFSTSGSSVVYCHITFARNDGFTLGTSQCYLSDKSLVPSNFPFNYGNGYRSTRDEDRNIVEPLHWLVDGEMYGPDLEIILPQTLGEKAFEDIKNKYDFTDDEMLSLQNLLIAAGIGGILGFLALGGMPAYLGMSLIINVAGILSLPSMKDKIRKIDSGQEFDSSITVDLVDLGSKDLDTTKQAIKDTDLKFPMSSMAIGEIANNQGDTLVSSANIPISEQTSTSNEVSQFLYDTITKSISKGIDIKDNIEKDLFSYKDFLNNFSQDLETFTPVNPSSKDILQRELDKSSSFDDIANKIIGDTSTGGSGTNLDKHIEGSQQDIKDKLGGGGSVVVPIIDGGGSNVDLSGVEGHLKTIGDSLVLIQQKNAQLNTDGYISNLHNNVVVDTEVKTFNKSEYLHEVDNKTKIVRDGEHWKNLNSTESKHTYTDNLGETRSIPYGKNVDDSERLLVNENLSNVAYKNEETKQLYNHMKTPQFKELMDSAGENVEYSNPIKYPIQNSVLFEDLQQYFTVFQGLKVGGD